MEIRDYKPPQTPTLATRIRRTFGDSLAKLQSAGEVVLLAAVGTAPWLPVAVVIASPLVMIARRHHTMHARRKQNATPEN